MRKKDRDRSRRYRQKEKVRGMQEDGMAMRSGTDDGAETVRLLRTHGARTITVSDLQTLFQAESLEELFPLVEACTRQGFLRGVVAQGTNGNRRYPLYRKYRITLLEADGKQLEGRIGALHMKLVRNGYLMRHQAAFERYGPALEALSQALFDPQRFIPPVSRKERSWALFGDEKLLDDPDFSTLLARLELDQTTLGFYDTPSECFPDYIPRRREQMTLLILENKDIWFNLRRQMFEKGRCTLFGVRLDGVIYGQGNRITASGALEAYTKFLNAASVHYLYWGDIDREGLNIYLRLKNACPDLALSLFVPGYQAMLRRMEVSRAPQSADLRERTGDYTPIYASFPAEDAGRLAQAMAENRHLPQELISYAVLDEEMSL